MTEKKKTIVVTGGAGFVGSHLCKALHEKGHVVISLDNYFTGSEENHHDGVDYRRGHSRDIEELVPETPDLVYHLGEYSRTATAMEEPELVFDLNLRGTYRVLEFCRKKNCKIVYAGSSTKTAPDRDDGITGRNLSPYTWAKAANTEMVANYGEWFSLPYAITYFYNVYGPGEMAGRYGTAVEIFRQHHLNGTAAHVNGPGTQTRNYTHVDDTVDGLLLVGEVGEGDEFGIGAAEAYSPIDLAEMFELEYEMGPQRKTSRPGSAVDTARITELGWSQKRTLKDYVEECKQ